MLDDKWTPCPDPVVLSASEVHVWRIHLDEDCPDYYRSLLSEQEAAAVERFRFERDRRRYRVAHGRLRLILSRYLHADPRALTFAAGRHGKPRLALPFDREGICFNLSHSDEIALVAVACRREVGIDLEQVRSDTEVLSVAEYTFSAEENRVLRALPPDQRRVAFFHAWTRKEAFAKAVGAGLSLDMRQFDVSLDPALPAMLRVAWDHAEVFRWSLHALAPAPGYVGAVAVEGGGWRLCQFADT